MINHPFGENLFLLDHPGRYTGGEINEIKKEIKKNTIRFALFYPEIYEVGMSNLGLKIIYHVLNSLPDVYAERVFLPWTDAIEYMKKEGIPLFTLETYTPLKEMDIIGFSLHTELNYTNLLLGLELAHIPLRRENRDENYPLIIVGGPCALNPLPLSPFVDFFAIGEGEELVKEIIPPLRAYKRKELKKYELLEELSKIEGIFVPEFKNKTKRRVAPLNEEYFPVKQIVPSIDIVHNRFVIEIMRGCTGGCRFCQGGFTYRPIRMREPEEVIKLVKEGIKSTGFEDVGLLAFTSSDYPYLVDVIKWLKSELPDTFVSLPSLPVDAIDEKMIEELQDLRRFSITLAPEVITEKLRNVINKNVPLDTIYRSIELAEKYNYPHVKLYFMIGLPQEEDEDIKALIDFLKNIERTFRRLKFKAAISPFVPRPHTPFQWVKQEDPETSARKIKEIRNTFRKSRRIQITYHNPYMSFLEGVLGRGDEELAVVLETALKNGAFFDSRKESFNYRIYEEAFNSTGVNPSEYTSARDPERDLPWEVIDTGVYKSFLKKEFERALSGIPTDDCMKHGCKGCGIWSKEGYELCRKGVRKEKEYSFEIRPSEEGEVFRYFLTYTFTGNFKFLSQRDISRILIHILRKTGIKLRYSKGFVPRPVISLPNPLPLGVESMDEKLYFETTKELNLNDILKKLNQNCPSGLSVKKIEKVKEKPDWNCFRKSIMRIKKEKIKNPGELREYFEDVQEKEDTIEFVYDSKKGSILKLLEKATGLESGNLRKMGITRIKVLPCSNRPEDEK